MSLATLDPEIRRILHGRILAHDPQTAIVDELPLCRGEGRADVAAINGRLIGYEIKSESDTLHRLKNQIPLYDSVFERTIIVVAAKHAEKAEATIPRHWGVIVVSPQDAGIAMKEVRRSRLNPEIDPRAVAMLMWRNEVTKALRRHEITVPKTGLIAHLWAAMLEALTKSEIISEARMALKARGAPAIDSRQTQDGD